MKIYFNTKTTYGIETIDELDLKDFSNWKDFVLERKRLKGEYDMVMGGVYLSQRCTNDWRQK